MTKGDMVWFENWQVLDVMRSLKPATKLADLLLPADCICCGCSLTTRGLCPDCWSDLTLITPPLCVACGRPLVYAGLDDMCGACLKDPFNLRHIRAFCAYDEASRQIILPFKHADRLDITPVMARLMRPAFDQLYTPDHLVIPIPLHWRRRWFRRYNQAAELARHLTQKTASHHQLKPDILSRIKPTRQMLKMTARMRRQNLKSAFQLHSDHAALIAGKPILLIDDVMTSGATLEAAAECLMAAGAQAVDGLVFARVLRGTR